MLVKRYIAFITSSQLKGEITESIICLMTPKLNKETFAVFMDSHWPRSCKITFMVILA